MRPAISDQDEGILRTLPLPLAQLYRQALNAHTPLERHQASFYCWEAAIKLLGVSVILECADRGGQSAQQRELLQSLARPSLGHWWGYCHTFIPVLAESAQGPFDHVNRVLLGPAQRNLPRTAVLDSALRGVARPNNANATPVRLRDLFDRVVNYRNDEVGHAALGMRANDFYADRAGALCEAFVELFGQLDVLAGRRLIYVREVRREPSGEWSVEHLELVGEVARRAEPFRLRPGGEASLPVPQRLYLLRSGEGLPAGAGGSLPPLGQLHPLLVYHEHQRRVYFLNAQQGRRHVEYLDYVQGERLMREDLVEAHRALLSRILASPMDESVVDRLADETNRDEPPPQGVSPPPIPGPVDCQDPGHRAVGELAGLRLVLLYKRKVQPDEGLLGRLETSFRNRGAEVFIDRHLPIGVDWARELERRVREADAVILLLSPASVHSEMLAYEVQIAHDEAQKAERGGRPRLLPIRLNFEDRLPAELAIILDRLQYFLWQGPQDDDRLVRELSAALATPAAAVRQVSPPRGAVALDSPFYVVRPRDQEFHDAVARQDSFILVCGARQMGKTSLLNRGWEAARQAGRRVALIDLQAFGSADLVSSEAFYRCLGQTLADELDLPATPADGWDSRRGPNANFERFLVREVLEKDDRPLFLGIDEVDRLFNYPFGSEVFGLFRSWHNARDRKPIWKRLTMAIAYATEAMLFITDLNQSPFNIGTRLSLEDFTSAQIAWLNDRFGRPLSTADDLREFQRLVGGHPYLVNRGLDYLARHGWQGSAFAADALREDGIFGDHLRRLLITLARDDAICDAVRAVLRGRPCPGSELFLRLRSGGVLSGDSARDARARCELYTRYLERHLL